MGRKCIVATCRSGYKDNKEQVSLFQVPKDEKLREKWVNVIPSKNDSTITTGHFVCEKHFLPSDIERSFVHKDKDGKIIANVAFKVPRLAKNAVPCLFPTSAELDSEQVISLTGDLAELQENIDPNVPHEYSTASTVVPAVSLLNKEFSTHPLSEAKANTGLQERYSTASTVVPAVSLLNEEFSTHPLFEAKANTGLQERYSTASTVVPAVSPLNKEFSTHQLSEAKANTGLQEQYSTASTVVPAVSPLNKEFSTHPLSEAKANTGLQERYSTASTVVPAVSLLNEEFSTHPLFEAKANTGINKIGMSRNLSSYSILSL